MIKPQEMIEMVEMAPLSLASRRIYNLLVKNAWHNIETVEQHTIEKKALRVGMGGATARFGQCIDELMAVIVRRWRGHELDKFQLLGYNTDGGEDDDNALFHYTFPKPLREIIRQSEVWARLESHVIYAFSSKYALALYELVALRANLKHKTSEIFELVRFRTLLGVEKEKLPAYKSLKQYAIDYAVREVNGLCPDFNVAVEPVMTGRKVTAVKVTWWPKSAPEKAKALREVTGSKVGRRERLAGLVEHVFQPPKIEAKKGRALGKAAYSIHDTRLSGEDIEAGKALLRSLGIAGDIYALEAEWREGLQTDPVPVVNPRKNFLQFIREKGI
jgi:hypothetical protein